MRNILILALLAFGLTGCATTTQHVATMDGDVFDQAGFSLFSKQKYIHGIDADFYPNNSGAHIAVKGEGDQDSTALVPVIQAAVQAALQAYTAGLAAKPPVVSAPSMLERLQPLRAPPP